MQAKTKDALAAWQAAIEATEGVAIPPGVGVTATELSLARGTNRPEAHRILQRLVAQKVAKVIGYRRVHRGRCDVYELVATRG